MAPPGGPPADADIAPLGGPPPPAAEPAPTTASPIETGPDDLPGIPKLGNGAANGAVEALAVSGPTASRQRPYWVIWAAFPIMILLAGLLVRTGLETTVPMPPVLGWHTYTDRSSGLSIPLPDRWEVRRWSKMGAAYWDTGEGIAHLQIRHELLVDMAVERGADRHDDLSEAGPLARVHQQAVAAKGPQVPNAQEDLFSGQVMEAPSAGLPDFTVGELQEASVGEYPCYYTMYRFSLVGRLRTVPMKGALFTWQAGREVLMADATYAERDAGVIEPVLERMLAELKYPAKE